jgi:twitching motility two-component system response regulator PilH
MAGDRPALILVVDDDYDFLEITRLLLERAGYRVTTAADPSQAFRKIADEKPDLVITDLMMTSLDSGFSFAQTLKEDPAHSRTPVIMTTSVSSALGLDFRPRSAEEQAQMHVDAYFDKPLDIQRLLAKIAELLSAAGQVAHDAGGTGEAAREIGPPGGER